MDYSFNAVNQSTIPLAPAAAMQFGHTLHRLLQRIVYSNTTFGPPVMAKIDLADGYYRVPLAPEAALELAVVLPSDGTDFPLVGIPLSIPMGWNGSPPFFCAFTETGADLANHRLRCSPPFPIHPLETVIQTTPFPWECAFTPSAHLPPLAFPPPAPLQYVDVYIDDFIALAQLPTAHNTMRTLLHTIHNVFHDVPDSGRRPVISLKKLAKGDAAWSCQKQVLGWNIDTENMTLALPTHRQERLAQLLHHTMAHSRISRRKWHRLLGELRSMAAALHSAKHMFSILQHVLTDQRGRRLRLNTLVRQTLHDWVALAQETTTTPVPLTSLVPTAPTFLGATDASKTGMGGFWLPSSITAPDTPPIVWRAAFPDALQHRLNGDNNDDAVTNSELELAAFVTGSAVAASLGTPTRPVLCCAVDNTPTLSWAAKGSATSNKPPAFLLRLLAQLCRSCDMTVYPLFTPGSSNNVADFCSRSFHLSDAEFLRELQCRFPTQPSWKLVQPTSTWLSNVSSSLAKKMLPWDSTLLGLPQQTLHGTCGGTFATPSVRTSSSSPALTPSHYFKFLPDVTAWESSLPAVLQSEVARWRAPFAPLARRWPHWGTPIPGYSPRANSTSVCTGN
jgi:hypothetical protein